MPIPKPVSITFTLLLFLTKAQGQQPFPLYDSGHIPNYKEGGEIPTLTLYKPVKDRSHGAAIIVCSGGGYVGVADNVEGIPAVKKLQQAGITAFLLDYREPHDEYMTDKSTGPLMDAQRAIQYVREHAKEYHIKPDKIGMMGFSAGGHLVSTVGTHFAHAYIDNPKNTSLRPDFFVLVYPVISFADSLAHMGSRDRLIGPDPSPEQIREFSNELQVTDDTPPCYLVHAMDDHQVKVENSLYFAAALRSHHVPVDLYLYLHGSHAFGVHNRTTGPQWIDDCIDWIKNFHTR